MPTVTRVPKPATLRRYGLSAAEWLKILARQRGVCAICKRVPLSGSWVTDHEHVPKFKRKPPEERKKFVRGVVCHFCNSHCVGRFMNLMKAKNIVVYLERYERGKLS